MFFAVTFSTEIYEILTRQLHWMYPQMENCMHVDKDHQYSSVAYEMARHRYL